MVDYFEFAFDGGAVAVVIEAEAVKFPAVNFTFDDDFMPLYGFIERLDAVNG